MKFSLVLLVALSRSFLGEANTSLVDDVNTDSSITNLKATPIDSEGIISDLTSIVSLLADRIEALEDTSRSDKQAMLSLKDHVFYLENKLEEMEDAVKADRKKISSLQNAIRSVQRRGLQWTGFWTRLDSSDSDDNDVATETDSAVENDANDASVCMPRFVNNRCIFGHSDIVAFRFENRTFFNDDVEFNENVGFDEDADCMPIYNSTSRQCVLNNNFIYESGTTQYNSQTKITFRSREVWMRPKKTFFRNTNTSYQGGALNILDDVDYSVAE